MTLIMTLMTLILLGISCKSSPFYDDVRCDGNNNIGFHWRDHKNYIHQTQGFNQDDINELFKYVGDFSDEEKYVTLL